MTNIKTDTELYAKTQSYNNYATTPIKDELEYNYFLDNEDKDKDKYNYYDMKAQDIEIERASKENLFVYGLLKSAEGGNCDAIKKLLNYSYSSPGYTNEFANSLEQEIQEMTAQAFEEFTNGAGELSSFTQEAIENKVMADYKYEPDSQKAQKEYDELFEEMQKGII